jgi:hypothetical protein
MELLFTAVFIFTSAPFAICHQGTSSETLAKDFSCCIKTALIFTTTIQDEALICQTVICVIGYCNYSHWSRHFLSEPYNIFTRVFISSNHCMEYPISPENIVTIDSQIKWMLWSNFRQDHSV